MTLQNISIMVLVEINETLLEVSVKPGFYKQLQTQTWNLERQLILFYKELTKKQVFELKYANRVSSWTGRGYLGRFWVGVCHAASPSIAP